MRGDSAFVNLNLELVQQRSEDGCDMIKFRSFDHSTCMQDSSESFDVDTYLRRGLVEE